VGRKRKKWLPLALLSQYAREEGIKTVKQYREWVRDRRPEGVPRFPERVYDDWVGFNELLGTNNIWGPYHVRNNTSRYLPYHEATRYIQQFQLGTLHDYWDWYDKNKPEFLPKFPQQFYKRAGVPFSWPHFLGKTAIAKLDMAEEKVTVFAIVKDKTLPFNVFSFILERDGQFALGKKIAEKNWTLVKMFKWDKERVGDINTILANGSSSYYGEKMTRMVVNIHQLVWDLSEVLDII
jgi:hypothetical protein